MIVLEFNGQTRVLNAPSGWNESEPIKCGMLPIRDTTIEGIPAMQSFWKLAPHDLAALAGGAHVRLTVYGTGHPPVWVDIDKCDAAIERAPTGAKLTPGQEAIAAVAGLRLQDAAAFFSVTVHRDARGVPVPTITVVTERIADALAEEMYQHMRGIADTLRRAYAPKEGSDTNP